MSGLRIRCDVCGHDGVLHLIGWWMEDTVTTVPGGRVIAPDPVQLSAAICSERCAHRFAAAVRTQSGRSAVITRPYRPPVVAQGARSGARPVGLPVRPVAPRGPKPSPGQVAGDARVTPAQTKHATSSHVNGNHPIPQSRGCGAPASGEWRKSGPREAGRGPGARAT